MPSPPNFQNKIKMMRTKACSLYGFNVGSDVKAHFTRRSVKIARKPYHATLLTCYRTNSNLYPTLKNERDVTS